MIDDRIAITDDGYFIYPYEPYLFPDCGVVYEYNHSGVFDEYLSLEGFELAWLLNVHF